MRKFSAIDIDFADCDKMYFKTAKIRDNGRK